MFKKGLRWGSIFLLLSIICLYSFRNTLTLKLANSFLPAADAQLTCLDWSLSGLSKIAIDNACIEHTAASITIEDAKLSFERLSITQLNVSLKPSKSNRSATSFEQLSLPLITERPLVYLEKVAVSGMPLLNPLSFTVHETQLNEFEVVGDIETKVKATKEQVEIAQLDLGSQLLQGYLPSQVKALSGFVTAYFDGQNIQFNSELAASILQGFGDCQLDVDATGKVIGELNLNSQAAVLDFSKYDTQVTAQMCDELIQQYLPAQVKTKQLLSEHLQLSLPNKIIISEGQLRTAKIYLLNEESNSIELSELDIGLSNQSISTQLQFEHQSDLVGAFTVSGPVELLGPQINTQLLISTEQKNIPELLTAQLQIQQAKMSLQASLEITGELTKSLSFKGTSAVALSEVKGAELSVPNFNFNTEFQGLQGEQLEVTAKGTFASDSVRHALVQSKNLKADWQAKLNGNALSFDANWQIKGLKQGENQLQGLQQTLKVQSSLDDLLKSLDFKLETQIDAVAQDELLIEDIDISSQGEYKAGLSLEHDISLLGASMSLRHKLKQDEHPFQFVMIEQSLSGLQPLIGQLVPQLKIETGSASVVANGDLFTQHIDFDVQFSSSALFDTHYISNASSQITGKFSSGLINIPKTKVTIDEFRSGAVLTNITADLQAQDNQAWLSALTAEAFDGLLTADKVQLTQAPQRIEAKAENLDLAILAKAGREAGVELTGRVSGELPIDVRDGKVSISEGRLYNLGSGMLSVSENASVNALKAQQPQLKTVIGLLDNLDIDTLNSEVSLTEDGWLTLGVNIKGENKSQAQPVNFNYTHHENIYTLFKALRLNDEISQQVEKALTQ